jgi:3-dehydro-L-gulonate 2-dehydrogenase
MFDEFHRVFLKVGFTPERGELLARLFTENMRDGVYSHGLMRVPSIVKSVQARSGIDPDAEPVKVGTIGILEQWDGQLGPGMLNAHASMNRAIELAKEHGMGCVGLRNTNHWMRAGAYGLQAAEAGFIGICWTNTTRLIPPYGSNERKVGNNPLVVGIPRPNGQHILLDMAMSQFSNGKLDVYREAGKTLPVPGGYDKDGNLSYDPGAIQESNRPLPIGHWKGVGLAMVLDLVGALLAGGRSTYQIAGDPNEFGVTQTYIAFDVKSISGEDRLRDLVDETISDFQSAATVEGEEKATYPGERMYRTRTENLEKGIPVDPVYWNQVLAI